MLKDNNKNLKENIKKIKPHKKRKAINFKKVGTIICIIIFIVMMTVQAYQNTRFTDANCTLEEMYKMQDDGILDRVKITQSSNTFIVYDKNGNVYNCVNPKHDTFIKELSDYGITIDIQVTSFYDSLVSVMLALPMLIIGIMLIYYLSSTIIGSSTKMFTLLNKENNKVTFDDIAGISEIKSDIMQTMIMIRKYKELAANGARPCKGILLYGPPGVGKTMIAKAIANEVNLPFISASGSDFVEMFVGVGAARVRSLWDLALQNSPCILFIDEIDSLGKRRAGNGGDNEKNQTLNALLQRMDGLNVNNGVIVIAATNDKDALDSALLRPGRFDKSIYIGPPRLKKDKKELIEIYLKNKNKYEEVTIDAVAGLIHNMTGAQIEDALNNAVYNSFAQGRNGKINILDIDRGIMTLYTDGVPVEISSEHDRRITAVHEAGHCIVNLLLGRKVMKISIIPYSSGIGGITQVDPSDNEDNKLRLRSEYMNDIKVLLAGEVAEKVIFNEHSQGASNDIERATEHIYSMITQYGFSETLVNYNVFVKNGLADIISKDVMKDCDKQLKYAEEKVYEMLIKHKEELITLSNALMTYNTIMFPTLENLTDIEGE